MRSTKRVFYVVFSLLLIFSLMLPLFGCSSNKSKSATASQSSTSTKSSASGNPSPPTSSSGAVGQENLVYSFGPASGTDGQHPFGGVMLGSDGILYGTTRAGGANGTGTVFKLSTSGAESILYSFAVNGGPGGDARFPLGGVVMDNSGNLWGTASYGGNDNHGNGTVFEISATGKETLYSLVTSTIDATLPCSTLVVDAAGNIYGTTNGSGSGSSGSSGAGTVFKISGGVTSILYAFSAAAPTNGPFAGLITDGAGNFYGTTENTGPSGGQVFQITAAGVESTVYSFTSRKDGFDPVGLLARDSIGNIYGTTYAGGAYDKPGSSSPGTVFKISPSGNKTTLYSFGKSTNDGEKPYGSVILDSSGNLYGTTNAGGAYGYGTLFKVSSSGTMTILYSFGASAADGQNPSGAILLDSAGNIWGATQNGGANGTGTVFEYGLVNKSIATQSTPTAKPSTTVITSNTNGQSGNVLWGSPEGLVYISVPSGWNLNDAELYPGAAIGVADDANSVYLIVTERAQYEIKTNATIDDYLAAVKGSFAKILNNPYWGSTSNITIGGCKGLAVQVSGTKISDGSNVVYFVNVLTGVKQPNFYNVCGWTPSNMVDQNKATLEKVINSFHEVWPEKPNTSNTAIPNY